MVIAQIELGNYNLIAVAETAEDAEAALAKAYGESGLHTGKPWREYREYASLRVDEVAMGTVVWA